MSKNLKVKVQLESDDKAIWFARCSECPMHPHQKALGQKLQECQAGMVTNMQGPVPIHTCQHLVKQPDKQSFGESKDGLFVTCGFSTDSAKKGN